MAKIYDFQIGKGVILHEGQDITAVVTGTIAVDVLQAARELEKVNIKVRVINLHTIKPIDQEILIKAARETGALITIEEHNINGGLGGAVAEVLLEADCASVKFERMGLKDFCHGYGNYQELKAFNGLSPTDIAAKLTEVYRRK